MGVVLSLALLGIQGCASSTPTPPAPTVTPSPEATATPSPEVSPTPEVVVPTPSPANGVPTPARYGGTLNVAVRASPPHLDVHQTVSSALAAWGPGLAYSRLLRYRSGPDTALPSMGVECDLCQSWEMPDPLTVVFHLRPDVRWHGVEPVNGRPLTARDVVYSLNRQRTPGWPNAPLLSSVARVEASDPLTVVVKLRAPDPDLFQALADGHTKVVAPEVVEAFGSLREAPVIGTGPWLWQLTDERIGTRLVANPDYFERGLPALDRLNLHLLPGVDSQVTAFKTGFIDVLEMSTAEWLQSRTAGLSGQQWEVPQPAAGLELLLRADGPPLDDPRVRRALFLALDPWSANQRVWQGKAFVASGLPLVEASWGLNETELQGFFNRPTEARSLLAQAVSEGLPLSVEMTVGDYGDLFVEYARTLADQLRDAGFEPRMRKVTPAQYVQQVWELRDFSLALGPAPSIATPNLYLLSTLFSGGGWNVTGHQDGELDRLLLQAVSPADPAERSQAVLNVQRRVLELSIRFLPAAWKSTWLWRETVRGLYPNPVNSEYFFWARAWLATELAGG